MLNDTYILFDVVCIYVPLWLFIFMSLLNRMCIHSLECTRANQVLSKHVDITCVGYDIRWYCRLCIMRIVYNWYRKGADACRYGSPLRSSLGLMSKRTPRVLSLSNLFLWFIFITKQASENSSEHGKDNARRNAIKFTRSYREF